MGEDARWVALPLNCVQQQEGFGDSFIEPASSVAI